MTGRGRHEEPSFYIGGLEPVREALYSQRKPQKILLRRDGSRRHRDLEDVARRMGVPCVVSSAADLDQRCPGQNQGAVALVTESDFSTLEDLEPHDQALVVAIDGVTDPMNLGAILRTVEGAGADGVIIPKRRAAPITPAAVRASAGACAHVRVVRVSSVADALLRATDRGFRIFGLDPAGTSLYEETFEGPLVLVVGEEGAGLHRLVRERCHRLLAVPMRGRVASLNVSVACGIALYEILRSRGDVAK